MAYLAKREASVTSALEALSFLPAATDWLEEEEAIDAWLHSNDLPAGRCKTQTFIEHGYTVSTMTCQQGDARRRSRSIHDYTVSTRLANRTNYGAVSE